jgi:hypothetical protein
MSKRIYLFPVLVVLLISTGCAPKLKSVKGDIPKLYYAYATVSDSRARVLISGIDDNQIINDTKVTLNFLVENFKLGKKSKGGKGLAHHPKGSYVGLIVDNQPPIKITQLKNPLVLEGLAPGVHTLRAYLATSFGETVKNGISIRTFYIQSKTGISAIDPNYPVLTVAMPDMEYPKRGKTILIDYFISGGTLTQFFYRTKLTFDGKESVLKQWQPYYLTGLSKGDHQFKLELVDLDGKQIPGIYNKVEKVINIR